MGDVVLEDTSLCAIVRDEKMNPAGGIERFVYAHVPHVEEAVIADTHSVDGTREILEALKDRFPNLIVIDIPFEGYATTRNKALTHIRTKRVLILDADELITHEKPENDWLTIKEYIDIGYPSYSFLFDNIYPEVTYSKERAGHLIRLFDVSVKNPFTRELWERVEEDKFNGSRNIPISIKHFLPSPHSLKMKVEEWYMDSIDGGKEDYSETERLEAWKEAPSNFPNFEMWKRYNSRRDDYK